jgi:DNA (cytosine-5)-methyltransferase 1
MVYRIADFFCGVGGIRLGFETASPEFSCVFSNDIDKNAVKTYEKNFTNHKVTMTSISDLSSDDIPNFDIFVGGFPCQSFSVAGNLKGFDDERGNLFFDIVRILKEKKPMAFLLENVKNLETHDGGKTYKRIKKELIQAGYFFKKRVMNSSQYGNVPQNRERIFLVGFRDKKKAEEFRFPTRLELRKTLLSILEPSVPNKYYYTEESKIYPVLEENVTEDVETGQVYQYRRKYVRANKSGVCPTLTANMGCGGHNVPIIKDEKGIRKLTPRECFSLQSFPKSYDLPNLADSHLYKQAGNSVTVKVVNRIAKNILKVLPLNKKGF